MAATPARLSRKCIVHVSNVVVPKPHRCTACASDTACARVIAIPQGKVQPRNLCDWKQQWSRLAWRWKSILGVPSMKGHGGRRFLQCQYIARNYEGRTVQASPQKRGMSRMGYISFSAMFQTFGAVWVHGTLREMLAERVFVRDTQIALFQGSRFIDPLPQLPKPTTMAPPPPTLPRLTTRPFSRADDTVSHRMAGTSASVEHPHWIVAWSICSRAMPSAF